MPELEYYTDTSDEYNDRNHTYTSGIEGFHLEKNGGDYELSFVQRFTKDGEMVKRAGRLKMTYSTFNELKHVLDVV